MNFSHCCRFSKRIVVDYQDKGWVQLLDLDYTECQYDEDSAAVVHVNECTYCEKAELLHPQREQVVSVDEGSLFNYFIGGMLIEPSTEPDGDQNSEERSASL